MTGLRAANFVVDQLGSGETADILLVGISGTLLLMSTDFNPCPQI